VTAETTSRLDTLSRAMPGLAMLRSYRPALLGKDLVAGLVVTTLLVPQGMAYAELAGLPAITGLYTTILALIGYALFGPQSDLIVIRFKLAPDPESATRAWLEDLLPGLTARPGLGSVHLLKGALAAAMTSEQRIRGADSGVDWALIATGYELEAVTALQDADLAAAKLHAHGMSIVSSAVYRSAYTLLAAEPV